MIRSFILTILFFAGAPLAGQDEARIDSLENVLVKLASTDTMRRYTLIHLWDAVIGSDLSRAKVYTRQMIREGKQNGSSKLLAAGYQRLGVTYSYIGIPDSTMHYYRKALRMYAASGNDRLQGIMLYNIAILQQGQGLYDTAKYYLALADERFSTSSRLVERSAVNKLTATIEREQGNNIASIKAAASAYELAREAGDSSRMADAEQEIAFNYMDLDQDRKAADYFQRTYRFYTRHHDDYFATMSLLNLVTCYQSLNEFENALHYGNQALEFVQKNQFHEFAIDVHNVMGNVYWKMKDYQEAERQFLLAMNYFEEGDFDRLKAETLTYLSGAQLNQNKFKEARKSGLAGLELSKEQGQLEFVHRNYGQLAIVAKNQGRYEEAYNHMVNRQTFQDSLYRKDLADEVARLTLLFDNEKKERLINEQKNQLALLESQQKIDRQQKISLGAGILTLICLLAAGWYITRQRHLNQRLEKDRLGEKVKSQQRELSTHVLQMAQKGQLLDQLGEELRLIKGERPDDRKKLDNLLRELGSEERIDQDWANFRNYFQGVHGDFEERLKITAVQTLSPRELRLATLIKMQLNNQEVGAILGVSQDSLYKAKYRLRKKLPQATEGELDGFIREL